MIVLNCSKYTVVGLQPAVPYPDHPPLKVKGLYSNVQVNIALQCVLCHPEEQLQTITLVTM